MRRVFVRFLEEIEDTKKAFRNQLTFRRPQNLNKFPSFLKITWQCQNKLGDFFKFL